MKRKFDVDIHLITEAGSLDAAVAKVKASLKPYEVTFLSIQGQKANNSVDIPPTEKPTYEKLSKKQTDAQMAKVAKSAKKQKKATKPEDLVPLADFCRDYPNIARSDVYYWLRVLGGKSVKKADGRIWLPRLQISRLMAMNRLICEARLGVTEAAKKIKESEGKLLFA